MSGMYVLMVVPSDFPNGDAGALRDLSFAAIYQSLGYKVVLIGAGNKSREGKYEGIHYYSIFQNADNFIGHMKRFLLSKSRYLNIVNEIIKNEGLPSVIHINDVSHGVIKNLCNLAIKKNIYITHDSTEWYSPCEFPRGELDKQFILKDHLNKHVIRSPIRVYAISSYLEGYFKEKRIRSVRIPVIMDVENAEISINTEINKIKLIYAGSPGRKDLLNEIVLGVEALSFREKDKIVFNVYGVNEDQIKEMTGLNVLSDCIRIHGHVSRNDVKNALLESDFSVLLRPTEERYAKAGFPTKSVEAMSHGVAMLCNISSDLGLYLEDMKNAIIVDGYMAEALTRAIRKLLPLSKEKITEIKKKARLTALQNFDYRLWIDVVDELLH